MNMHTPTLDEAMETNTGRQRAKRSHIMNIMDRSGHQTMSWNPDDPEAVKTAKAKFDEYKRQGYQAFALDNVMTNGVTVDEKGRRIETFDPAVEKLMLIPQLRGG